MAQSIKPNVSYYEQCNLLFTVWPFRISILIIIAIVVVVVFFLLAKQVLFNKRQKERKQQTEQLYFEFYMDFNSG